MYNFQTRFSSRIALTNFAASRFLQDLFDLAPKSQNTSTSIMNCGAMLKNAKVIAKIILKSTGSLAGFFSTESTRMSQFRDLFMFLS